MTNTLCKCGTPCDPRSKTGLCLKCYNAFRKANRKPNYGGSQYKVYGKSHYERNKTYYFERKRERIKMLTDFVNDYKRQHPCVDCGNPDFRVLTFDHTSLDKEKAVSTAIQCGWSKERILSEIRKCEVRCSNCHTIMTIQRRKNFCDTGV